MSIYINVILISFFITLVSILLLRPLAVKYNFVDTPNDRKDHEGLIPMIGGPSIFLGLLASQIYLGNFNIFTAKILFAFFLMLALGIYDDIVNMNAKIKLLFQFLIVTFSVYLFEIQLENLGYLFGMNNIIMLGSLSMPITIVGIVALTNAFNMLDGHDGVAGGLLLISLIGIIAYFTILGKSNLYILILALISGIIIFIIFNVIKNKRWKIFLGDGGSLFLGFSVSWLLIISAQTVDGFPPSFALWCIALPLFDFLTVLIIRFIKKRPLMIGAKDHLHHWIKSLGFSRIMTLVIIILLAFSLLLIGFIVEIYLPIASVTTLICLFLFYFYLRV